MGYSSGFLSTFKNILPFDTMHLAIKVQRHDKNTTVSLRKCMQHCNMYGVYLFHILFT